MAIFTTRRFVCAGQRETRCEVLRKRLGNAYCVLRSHLAGWRQQHNSGDGQRGGEGEASQRFPYRLPHAKAFHDGHLDASAATGNRD